MSSPSPSPVPRPSSSPSQKLSLRKKMGSLARRSSSFLVPSRPSTPAVRPDSDDPMGSRAKAMSSKPSSIYSVEAPPHVPLVVPQEKPEDPKEVSAPVEVPVASAEVQPAVPETVPEPVVAAAQEPVTEPPAESGAPEARATGEQKPAEESYAAAYISENSEPSEGIQYEEPRHEPENEHHSHGDAIPIPFHDSPKSFSLSLSRESVEHDRPASSTESHSRSSSESPSYTKSLSVKTSHENLHPELSPIVEDEHSAVEERNMPFAHPTGGLPPSNLSAPPIVAPTLSEASGGTTPRAMPIAFTTGDEHDPHASEAKGKEKEVNGSAVHYADTLPKEGYFSKTASMPIPHVADEHYDVEDPFRDPEPASSTTTHYDGMPEPEVHRYDALEQSASVNLPPAAPMDQSQQVVYSLPPLNEVTYGNLRSVPSDYTLGGRGSRVPSVHNAVETDETLPLLSHSKNTASSVLNKPLGTPRHDFENAGWTAYSLPDSTTYYVHPATRITTDINLQNPRKLVAVTSYVSKKLAFEIALPVDGLEIWLHDEAQTREDFVPVRCWVDHEARALGYWPPPGHGNEEPSRGHADDRLDREYRYWAFMESHPVHTPLPVNAYAAAMDKLTWSYTDRLLKANRRAPPPFTQHESQELLNVLRSTSGSDSPVQAAIQTRVVARILRRIVQWKQHFFRPEKPLPRGVEAIPRTQRSGPYRRTFLDFIAAWLCLGIPYLYANRHTYRFDEEGGLMRSAGPMLVVGATVCIVAATILVASLTFIALPGLDQVSRTAGFIAIIGAFASLGASVIAAFRNNVEVQRWAARGGEGIVVSMSTLTGDSILPSLPAVFLVWSIISLVTGVVLYVFRGTVAVDTSHWTRIASFTRWTTLGVLGFCGGVLIASMFAIRR